MRRSNSRVGKQPRPVWWMQQVEMAPRQASTSTAAIYHESTTATVSLATPSRRIPKIREGQNLPAPEDVGDITTSRRAAVINIPAPTRTV